MAEINYAPNPGGNVSDYWHGTISFGTGAPTGTGFSGYVYIDDSSGDIYQYVNGAWVLQVTGSGGGVATTVQISASSDPSGVPTGNARLWFREDTGSMWLYNTTTAAWDKLF